MELQKASGFLKNAYYQGHGRYVSQIARLTFKFCKFGGSSRELRKFVETRLVDVARENPGCAMYVKPRMFKSPVLTAEYLNEEKQYVNLHQMSAKQIEAWMTWFLTRSGHCIYRFNEPLNTANPSVQGQWTPFYWRDQSWNTTKFPSTHWIAKTKTPSATEQLIDIAREKGLG